MLRGQLLLKRCHLNAHFRGPFLKSPETFRALYRALYRVAQFPLYLRNAGVLTHQTSQSSWFFLL